MASMAGILRLSICNEPAVMNVAKAVGIAHFDRKLILW